MEYALEFARGPLFIMAFGFMVLGLIRVVGVQLWFLLTRSKRSLSNAPWRTMMRDMFTWIVPASHAARSPSVPFIVFSFAFHTGMIIVAFFFADHTALWKSGTGIKLPSLGYGLADALTAITLISLVYLFASRIIRSSMRATSDVSDYLILLLIGACFVTGYFANHPNVNPLPWNVMMLMHILCGNLILVLIPVTKLAHAVLYPFTRLSPVHWQFRPGAGEEVARTLYGNEAKV